MFRWVLMLKACNRQVDCIDKRHCMLTKVPDDIARYASSLEDLLLDCNHIKELPESLFRLNKLQKLTISDNEIGSLPMEIANLSNLAELDASKNEIVEIPEVIKFLRRLKELDLSFNPLKRVPNAITHLTNLKSLSLNEVELRQLPSDIGNLVNLESLELRENLIKTLPPSFASLNRLQRLDLGNNQLCELPKLIGDLIMLQELWLDENDLKTLPKEIGNLRKLTCLDVSDNKLTYLPEEIAGLWSLTDLHLTSNQLEQLPDGIGHLNKLIIFKVNQNSLDSLNPTIGGCSSLQELVLTENSLYELPPTIGNLLQLCTLNLDRNYLTELPAQIGNLTKLSVLSLRQNRITHLPVEIGQLRVLQVLDVARNKLQYLPYTITALNLKALWLAENQSQPLLKFQNDYDEQTGAKVLTCYLLPQEEFESSGTREHPIIDNLALSEDTLLAKRNDPSREPMVRFPDQDSDEANNENLNKKYFDAFVRHDTPHPKDFKNRYKKVTTNERQKSSEAGDEEKKQSYIESVHESNSNRSPSPANSESSQASSVIIRTDSDMDKSRNGVEDMNISGEESRQVIYHHPQRTSQSELVDDDKDASVVLDEEPRNTSRTSIQHHSSERHVLFPDQVDRTYRESREEDEEVEYSERQLVSENPDEEGDDGEEGIETNDDEHERPERHKLHRRDTPHHLKNKRVNVVQSKEEQEKFASILREALKKESVPGSINGDDISLPNNSSFSNTPISPMMMGPVEIKQMKFYIVKAGGGMGLTIAGGKGSTPFKGNDEGIFISRITPGGPVDSAGLRVGDKILAVNDINLEDADHYKAVDTLKNAGSDFSVLIAREVPIQLRDEEVVVPVERTLSGHQLNHVYYTNGDTTVSAKASPTSESVPASTLVNALHQSLGKQQSSNTHLPEMDKPPKPEAILKKQILNLVLVKEHSGLGFSVTPAKDGKGVCISRIAEGGAAEKNGKLRVGDKILFINGTKVDNWTKDQVVEKLIEPTERYFRLVIEREPTDGDDSNRPVLPKIKPYTGLYSSSYLANRPSYTGSYKRPSLGSLNVPYLPTNVSASCIIPQTDSDLKSERYKSKGELNSSVFQSASLKSSASVSALNQAESSQVSDKSHSKPPMVIRIEKKTIMKPSESLEAEFPPPPTAPGVFKEIMTKTTFTETTTTRVTNNIFKGSSEVEHEIQSDNEPGLALHDHRSS